MAKLTKAVEDKILAAYRAAIGEGIDHCESKHARWEENQMYVRGEQWSKADIERQARREKPAIPWNEVFKVVHAVSNKEMVQRLVPKVFGRNSTDEGVANILDEACRWQRDMANSEQYESMAFRAAAICGYGVVHKYWDATESEGDGMIKDEDVPLCEMLWPSRAREMNLSDRRWQIRGKWVDIDVADERWGGTDKRVSKMLKSAKRQSEADAALTDTDDLGKSESSPAAAGWGWGYVRAGQFMNLAKKEVFVGEYEWLEVEYKYKAAVPVRFYEWVAFVSGGEPLMYQQMDPQTQQPVEQPVAFEQYDVLDDAQKQGFRDEILAETDIVIFETRKELNEFLDLYEEVVGEEFVHFAETGIKTVKFAIVLNDKIVDTGVRPYGYSYYFITGFPFETRDGMDFYGIPDIIKGQQDYKNALVSTLLAMFMTSPRGGFFIEKSALNNIGEVADTLSSPNPIVVVEDGVVQNFDQRIRPIPQPTFPTTIGALLEILGNGVQDALGLDPISMGMQSDLRRVSGKTAQASQLASNVIVAILFDSMRMFRKQYGMCNAKFLTWMYDPEEIIRIVGEEKAQDIPQDQLDTWSGALRFDIKVDEQPVSVNEMYENLDLLTRTGDFLKMLPVDSQLDFIPISESKKREILKKIGVATQNQQLQQQLASASQIVQQQREFLMQSPEGQMLLASFDQMQQNNLGEQKAGQAQA